MALSVWMGAGRADAQAEPPLQSPHEGADALRFSAPAGCGDADALRRATLALLAAPIPAASQLDASVEATSAGFRLSLRTGGVERRLEAADCASLLDAAALIWALSIDPAAAVRLADAAAAEPEQRAAGEETRPEPLGAGQGGAPSAPAGALADPLRAPLAADTAALDAPQAPASRPSVDSRPVSRFRLSAGFALDAGSLPSASPGGELELGLRLSRVRLSVGARAFSSRRGRVQSGSAAHGDVALGAGFANVALPFGGGRLRADAHATLELGALWARGGGVAYPGRGKAPWVALGAGLGGELELGRGVALLARVDLLVPLNRPLFLLAGVGDVHRPAPLSLRASFGLAYHFGARIGS